MALSGSLADVIVASGYKLSLDWTATQDIGANKSTITAKLYWESLSSYYTVNSSQSNDAAIQHDDGTFSIESHSPSLDANQKKLINTYQFPLTHDADGTKSFSLDAYFDAQVTLSGNYYGRIDMVQQTFTLNTIPRASSLTGGLNWTAGSNTTFTVDRASTSFTHDIEIWVGATKVKTLTGVGTSASSSFSGIGGNNETIFGILNGAATAATKAVLITKDSGGNVIGSKTYSGSTGGTVTAPAANTISVPSFNIGGTAVITVTEKDSEFTTTITAKAGTYNAPTIATKSSALTINWSTASIASSLYGQCINSATLSVVFTATTYYGNTVVRSATTKTVTANVVGSNPTFTTFTYNDQNPTTAALTNPYKGASDPFIIQGKSSLRVMIVNANKAQGVNQANINKYVITVNGTPKTFSTPFATDIIWDYGVTTATSNFTITVTVYDSRGFTKTLTKTCNIVPWSKPVVNATAVRTGGYQNETTLSISGTISPITVNGTKTNAVKSPVANSNYAFAVKGAALGSPVALTGLGGVVPIFTTTDVKVNSTTGLDNTQTWTIVVTISDALDTTTVTLTVGTGKPIFFIDDVLQSLGFNDYPSNPNEFILNGTLRFGANLWAASGGAMNMGNGDILMVNGVWYSDIAEHGAGEGLMFLKGTAPVGSVVKTDYYNFLIDKDGQIFVDNGNGRFVVGQPATIQGGTDSMLKLISTNNTFIEFFNDGTGASRAGWLGYGNPSPNNLTMSLRNEKGDISITPLATSNKINLNGDVYVANGGGLTLGTANSNNTGNQLIIYNTGDAIVLQSGNNLDAYNSSNIVWKTSGGIMVGRIHVYGTSYATSSMLFDVTDETGVLNPNPVMELNAAGANFAKFDGDVLPAGDNARKLGNTSLRFAQLYAGTATINTSDEREKQQISLVPDEWLDAWAEVNYVTFKFNKQVEEKGDDARWHVGVIAQSIERAFEKYGLDAFKIGILCYDEWKDEDGNSHNLYGIRADECQFLEMALMRRELNKIKGVA